MNYRAALFDMDGTILDTLEDMHQSVNATLRHFSLPEIRREDTRAFVGNGARRLIEQAVPADLPPEQVEEILRYYLDYYNAHSNIATGPYAGIPELLQRLKQAGMRVAVVSNKPARTVSVLVEEIFDGVFESWAGEKDGLCRKPYPDMVLAVMEAMGLPPAECAYIGDSEVDIATAANAGTPCVSVTWGFRDRDVLERAGAGCLVDTVAELEQALLG